MASSFWAASGAVRHSILVTGGGSGIGLAFAKRMVLAGHEVVVCGRRLEQLAKAKEAVPELIIIQGDVSTEIGRIALAEKIIAEYPQVNCLVNNAGIQNRLPPFTDPSHKDALWPRHKEEMAINFEAPMHLALLLLPHLLTKPSAQIVNVTSGLAFVPISFMPVYCATKAAMHSFTMSLRQQLLQTPCSVLEIVPPAVNTDLGGAGLHTFGENLDEFADSVWTRMQAGELEIGFKMSEMGRLASREQLDQSFKFLNAPQKH